MINKGRIFEIVYFLICCPSNFINPLFYINISKIKSKQFHLYIQE